jgi:hypothetical protein
MLKLKLILMLLLISFLSSCKNQFPSIEPQVRCINVLLVEKDVDGDKFYSGYCRCHLYEWSIDRIGRVGESIDYDLAKCNKLIGFEPDTYSNVYIWWENIRLWLNRNKK